MKCIALVPVAAFLVLGGCAALQRDSVQSTENHLAASGFTVIPANTPARQAMLASLPPERVSQRIEGAHVSYLYADTILCKCLYVGGQRAWGRYQADAQARRLARDQIDAAEMNDNDMGGWDWGPWGGYGPGFYD
jgi:hypothetical protein